MHVLRPVGFALLIVVAFSILATDGSAQNYLLDQSNDRSVPSFHVRMYPDYVMGQSFAPEVDEIGFAAFWISRGNPGLPVELQVLVREITVRGPILGRSSREPVPNMSGGGPIQVTFTPPIRLVPRRNYVLELLVHGEGGVSLAVLGHDSYPRGSLIRGGEEALGDAWFREGLLDLAPVLETSWGELKSVYR